MKIQIKRKSSLEVLFETEAESMKEALEKAVKQRVYLGGAYLGYADLKDANLRGANLGGVDLGGADLRGANLRDANLGVAYLKDANLRGANLRGTHLGCANLEDANLECAYLRGTYLGGAYLGGVNLRGASLSGADLRNANLRDAYLRDADLRGAYLRDVNLSDANWDDTKKDMLEKLALMPDAVPYLYKAIYDGKIDGSIYEGECACFYGTLANAKQIPIDCLSLPIKRRISSPIEIFFLGIRQGDNPENNPLSKLASEWIEEFSKEKNIVLPKRKVVWE